MAHLQRRPEELHRLRGPDASDEPLKDAHEGFPVAFEGANENHDQVSVGKQLGSVADAIVDHFGSVHFLQRLAAQPNWHELQCLVAEVEWEVKHDIPKVYLIFNKNCRKVIGKFYSALPYCRCY